MSEQNNNVETTVVGVISSVEGDVFVKNASGETFPVADGQQVLLNQIVQTGENGALLVNLITGSEPNHRSNAGTWAKLNR